MVRIYGEANLIFWQGAHSGWAIDQRPEGTKLRRAVDMDRPPVPILSTLLPRNRYALSVQADYDDLIETLETYFRKGGVEKYSGPWYLAMVEVGALTFADVVMLTGLTAAEVADMVYDAIETEVGR